MRILGERIAQRGFIVHEEAECFGLEFVQIEPRGKADLHGQVSMLRIRPSAESLAYGIEPFLDAALGTEPRSVMVRVVRRETRYGSDAQYPAGLVWRAAVEVVLGESAHQPVAAKKQCQRLNDGRLAAVIRSDQHSMAAQRNIRRSHPTKAADFQADNVHGGPPSTFHHADELPSPR
jgi:hypothetical protein